MTTLGFKSRAPSGQGHGMMGQEVKIGVKVAAPQAKLTFEPGRPPTLDPDPAPAPAKPQGHRWCWPGQMLSHLSNMFSVQPTVNWVNPQLVRECPPPPPLLHYNPPTQQQVMPPPALTLGGGLWHPAPPNNQQQQMMMDPIMMLQEAGTGGGYLGTKMGTNGYYPSAKVGTNGYYPSAKMGTNGYHPSTKMGTNGYHPSAKMGTNGYHPSTKMGTNGYHPSAKMGTNGYHPSAKMGTDFVYPSGKSGTSNCFPGTKFDTNGYYPGTVYLGTETGTNEYYPSAEVGADCDYPSTEMGTNGYVFVARSVPESCPPTTTITTTTTTTTTSKPLNPYAQEWVPQGYTTTPSTPVVMKAAHHHQESSPIIPYSPQDFQSDPVDDTLSASSQSMALGILNGTQIDPVSATSQQEGPGQSRESKSPVGCLEERVATEGPILCPELREVTEGGREGRSASPQTTASPGQDKVCFVGPASPDCVKVAKPDLSQSTTRCNTSLQSAEEVRICFKVPASPDCMKVAKLDLGKSSTSSNDTSQSPGEVRICFKVPASSDCMKVAKPDLGNSTPRSDTSLQSPERVQICVRLPSERTQSAKGVPSGAEEGYKSATRSNTTKGVPGSDAEDLVSATPDQRVQGCEKNAGEARESVNGSPSATVSYARVVERASPSPPPPQSTEDEKYKGVEQPIPKIFQRDRTPQREVPPPAAGTCRMPELFRRPTKDQRTRSRRFLKELKELSGGGEWCSSSSSSSPSSVSSSSSSSSCDLTQISSSPHIPSSSSSSQPLPPSSSSSSSFPSSSPVPISPLHHPHHPRSTPPVTPNSPGRERSESESSATSLDIDFADDVDCAVVPQVSAATSASAKKPINRFLACILGSGDSDSEEEEDDEEEDWDEVCVDSAGVSANGVPDLDDTWEIFGLEMIALQCRKDPEKEECQEVPGLECQADSSNLAEVNARWEREVGEGVPAKSATRVSFGGTTIHPMVVWSHAYRKARSGPWEQQARDRARFKQRIGTVEAALAPILEASHRTAVYERLYGTTTTTGS